MQFQPTNTFRTFTGTLCQLDHQKPQRGGGRATQNPFLSNQFQNTQNFQFNNSFAPFQQGLGAQYGLSNNDSQQLVGMFVNMISDILGNISSNFMSQNQGSFYNSGSYNQQWGGGDYSLQPRDSYPNTPVSSSGYGSEAVSFDSDMNDGGIGQTGSSHQASGGGCSFMSSKS